jgi:hypothetical protein
MYLFQIAETIDSGRCYADRSYLFRKLRAHSCTIQSQDSDSSYKGATAELFCT